MPSQRGSAQSTATISRDREYETRERRGREAPPLEHRPPRHHLPMKIAGILGILLLGGLIAGLVASHPLGTAPVAARALNSFGATGSAVSPRFTVPSSSATSTYGYRCPAGTTGHFTANLASVNGADTQRIADTSASSVSGTARLHPRIVGGPYYVAVTAPAGCAYRINTSVP